jgi:cell division protein FtsL
VLDRAERDAKSPQSAASTDRRYIYSGDPQDKIPGYAIRPRNTTAAGTRKRATFNIVAALFLIAIVSVAYVSNILAVNQLTVEVNRLEQQYEKIENANKVLKAEINRKSAWERIGNVATQQLGLQYPKERPEQLEIDASRLEKFQDK